MKFFDSTSPGRRIKRSASIAVRLWSHRHPSSSDTDAEHLLRRVLRRAFQEYVHPAGRIRAHLAAGESLAPILRGWCERLGRDDNRGMRFRGSLGME